MTAAMETPAIRRIAAVLAAERDFVRASHIAQSMPVEEECFDRWPEPPFHDRVNLW
jgi:hypothetical protein